MPESLIVEIADPELKIQDGNRIFTSLEGENPGLSMKDHMVQGEIEFLLNSGKIKAGGIISEVSAGSTATSLAHYCKLYDLKCTLFVPKTVPSSLVESLQARGAEVFQEDMADIYPNYEKFLSERPGSVRFDQLFDFAKRRHYHSLGQRALQAAGKPFSAIVGAVGTGHSLLGTAEGCQAAWIVSSEPHSSFKVPGVRNIEVDRYGDKDQMSVNDFNQRVIIENDALKMPDLLKTSAGDVQIGASFKLVLAGVQEYLHGKTNQTVFALGASLKRL